MKKIQMNYKLLLGCLVALSLTVVSCDKDPGDDLVGKGVNLLGFTGETDSDNAFSLVAYDAVKQTRTIVWIERSAISTGVMSSTATVDFTVDDQTVIDDYNTANGTSFVILPASNYTLKGVSGSSFSFASGEGNKAIDLEVDPNGLDLSQQYALPIVMSNPSTGYTLGSGKDKVLVQIIIKNQYDGIYSSVGTRYNFNAYADYLGWYMPTTSPAGATASTAAWNFTETSVSTRGAATVNVHVGNSNGGFGFLNLTVNGDNTVTCEASGETGVASLIPLTQTDYVSTYDPDTKTFDIYYQYTNSSGTFRILHDVLTYVGPQ